MARKTRLQVEREKRNMTQEELSEKLAVPPDTVSRWERAIQIPGPANRSRLATFFGEEVDNSWFRLEDTTADASSLLNVPYSRNPYFTDQKNLVQRIREYLTTEEVGAASLALSGLGGIGKTQLALAYAYAYQSSYRTILWVGASTQAQLRRDFVRIAMRLQVPEAQKTKPRQHYLVNEVLHWLKTHNEWLLILDNVEEELNEKDSGTEEDVFRIEHLLMKKGHILLTTRAQSIAHLVRNIALEEMHPDEGAQLLLLRDGQQSSPDILNTISEADREEALTLSELLGGLPLALEQARAYIEATGCGLARYRQLYEEYRKQLLREVPKNSRLRKEYKESVATTWLISFKQIEQQSGVASDALKLCAYLAPDGIAEDIILKGAEKLDAGLHQIAGNEFQFNDICKVLLNYSLIKRSAGVLSIHRLIQAVLQDRMDEKEQQFWAEQAVRAVQHAFYWAADQAVELYIPQAHTCAVLIEKYRLESQEAANLLKMVAKAVDERGWYAQAQPLYVQAFHAYVHSFGPDDTRTLDLLFDVLHIHHDMGMSLFAADAYRRIIADFKQVLGPDHPNLLALLNNITWIQIASGEYERAMRTVAEALQLLQRIPDVDIVERAKTYQVVAEILVLSGNADRADVYYQEAKTIFEQRLGPEHQEVANTLMNWGAVYARRGDLEQAERLVQQAVEIRQRTYGRDHPETADGLVILAAIVWKKGRYSEAEEHYQHVLTIRQQKLGQYNSGVLQTLRSLAKLAAVQKKDEEADRYFHEALALAPPAGEMASDEYKLLLEAYAEFLQERGRIEEAVKYLE